ncbi:hypothetical protein H072_850 [Dactylellina haptotyla CBS 200.50]|uniref:Multicopper oxidase n=1 Tax=Dactylellina haptotyla (strain CBS 200.50) TaxID=1284197 RepID=S8AW28_DACHA|nr:hypothetical protein H072_850 [Dactylellina haptotyla CBS 200.50]
MAFALKPLSPVAQRKDEEDDRDLLEVSNSRDMERKRKALFRSVLLLLAAGILAITVGALLTRFEGTFRYATILKIPNGLLPSNRHGVQKNASPKPDAAAPEKSINFRRDPSEYILSPPDWPRIRVQPKVKEYEWTITDVVANPDGVMRPMVLIDGKFPGPLIECNENDIVKVTIHNNAVNATSFHWHGLFHNGSNWMDGTAGVTQCPIPPGESFTYEIKTTGQYGTYWYHSHFSTQYTDGLFGPLVIHSPREPGRDKYKTDQVVMLHDHYHDLSRNLLYTYLAPDAENAEPIPDSALINGRNIRDCSKINKKYSCNSTDTELSEFYLSNNDSHRLRFINVGAFAEFELDLDEHMMEVIEADGTSLIPSSYHKLSINVAQRYSAIVHANSTAASEFWLRARMINHCFSDPKAVVEPEVRAIVRYSSQKVTKPEDITASASTALPIPTTTPFDNTISLTCKDLDGKLEPAIPMPAPEPDMLLYLRSNFEIGNYSLSRGFFNSSTWKKDLRNPALNRVTLPKDNIPVQLESEGIMHNLFDVEKGMVIKIDGVKVVDLLIDNYDDGNHPMHLHGHKFWVMAGGNGYYNMSNYKDLPRGGRLLRDTATLEGFGYLLIRFVTDNPGMWAFHCHNVWHAEAGLMMSLFTRPEIVKTWELPSDLTGFCSHPNATNGFFDDVKDVVPIEWRHDNGED